MLEKLIPVVAPVFIGGAIGYAWAKSGRRFDAEMVMRLSTKIGVPALVFATLVDAGIDLAALGRMAWATAAVTALFGAVGAAALTLTRIPLRPFLPAMMFPNVGNMGLPLALLAFDEAGFALAIAFFIVSVVIPLTAGVAISSGKLGLGGGLAVAWAFGLEGFERAIPILRSAMPVAVFNFLFAQRYDTDPAEVAGLVMFSTLFGFAVPPFLLGALV